MNANEEDKLGMFLKCQLFFETNAAALSANPAFDNIKTRVEQAISDLLNADSTATRNLEGFTTNKRAVREQFQNLVLKVAAACRGYYTANTDVTKKNLVKLTNSQVRDARDSQLIVIADQVADVAAPIQGSLDPFGANAADVASLAALSSTYRQVLQRPRAEEIISQAAGDSVDDLFDKIDNYLDDADDHMAVFEFTNPSIFQQYKLSRAIDDSGGAGGSEGYTLLNYTVPANGYINFYTGALPTDKEIYFRVNGGNGIIICTANEATEPCTSGFTAQPNQTYKVTLGELNLDLSKQYLQFTNTGTVPVVVRAGFKE